MGVIYQKPLAHLFPPAASNDSLDVTMRALYEIARFPGSVARIGMTHDDIISYIEMVARRAISHVETMDKEIAQ